MYKTEQFLPVSEGSLREYIASLTPRETYRLARWLVRTKMLVEALSRSLPYFAFEAIEEAETAMFPDEFFDVLKSTRKEDPTSSAYENWLRPMLALPANRLTPIELTEIS